MSDSLEALYREHRVRLGDASPEAFEALRAATLLALARALAERGGLSVEPLDESALASLAAPVDFSSEDRGTLEAAARRASQGGAEDRFELAHGLGGWLDRMAALDAAALAGRLGRSRAASGSFFTPGRLAREVVEGAGPHLRGSVNELRILDPAAGGGAFLLEAARYVFLRSSGSEEERRVALRAQLFGVDVSRLACATLEMALHLALALPEEASLVRTSIGHGDSLTGAPLGARPRSKSVGGGVLPWPSGFDFTAFSRAGPDGFDWIVGNPPWVAYQGRATRPISAELRRYYRERYRAFSGYPTLQAMFVERAAQLAPRGLVTLLLPSSLADLDGYRSMREVLTETHEILTELREFGEDAFEGVVQPCFALVATPRESSGVGAATPWRLRERRTAGEVRPRECPPPPALLALREGPRLPPGLFGELGFQTNRVVGARLLSKTGADERHTVPLLEGKDVREFFVGPPRVFLEPDLALLAESGVRLRRAEEYRRASVVLRQTAAFPIAALHTGLPFRNSLLAGFGTEEYPAPLLVGLLNSTLLRAYHLASQRDARQLTFPQLKVAHLRGLPAPKILGATAAELAALASEISSRGAIEARERLPLDDLVFELFGLSASEAEAVREFFTERTSKRARA